jgi:hypothetical protein
VARTTVLDADTRNPPASRSTGVGHSARSSPTTKSNRNIRAIYAANQMREKRRSLHHVGVNDRDRPPGELRFMSSNEYVAEFGWRGRWRLMWGHLRRGHVRTAWHDIWLRGRR